MARSRPQHARTVPGRVSSAVSKTSGNKHRGKDPDGCLGYHAHPRDHTAARTHDEASKHRNGDDDCTIGPRLEHSRSRHALSDPWCGRATLK
jgi:hypothetical protein